MLALNRTAAVDQLELVDLIEGPGGLPLLKGVLANCVCSVERVVRAGDHDVVIGEVEWIKSGESDKGPLLYYEGLFWTLKQVEDGRVGEPV